MKYFSNKIINKNQLISNFCALKNFTKKDVCAVVKANAYGHNLKTVSKILSKDCNFFAVQNLYEAIEVRKLNKNCKILVLGYTIDYNLAEKFHISVTIDSIDELLKVLKLNKKLCIHLKINTGMNRFGIKSYNELNKILHKFDTNKNIKLEGVYTHLYNSTNIDDTFKQIDIFKTYLSKITKRYKPIVHIGGSGAIFYKFDFVDYYRCGISLYGYNFNFVKPCLQIESKIIKIFNVLKDEKIGYDGTYVASKNMKIAIVPLGYADGILQNLYKDLYVIFKNKKLKVVGKICMDMFMIDVTNINISTNDYVTVFCNGKIWEQMSNVSVYEILTGFNKSRTNICVK